jgi:hypothetical protein
VNFNLNLNKEETLMLHQVKKDAVLQPKKGTGSILPMILCLLCL